MEKSAELKRNLMAMDLQFFAEGGDEGADDQGEGAQNSGEGEGNAGEEAAAEPKNAEGASGKSQNKTIPYERFKQVNDKAKQFEETFKELGIDGPDALKDLVSDYQAKKEAEEQRKREEMDEVQRLQADLEAKSEAEAQYQRELESLRESMRQEKIRNEFVKKAHAANVEYVDDAIKLADFSAVEVSEDGEIVGVEEAVEALVESKPFLLAQKKTQKPVGEPSNSGDEGSDDKTKEQLLKDAAERARATGKAEDRMKYAKLKRELGV